VKPHIAVYHPVTKTAELRSC